MSGAILIWGPARKWMREPRLARAVVRPRRFLNTSGLGAFLGAMLFLLFQGKSSVEFELARSPVRRLRLWVTMGAMVMTFGLWSVFFVAGPGFMRILLLGALLSITRMLIRCSKKPVEAKGD